MTQTATLRKAKSTQARTVRIEWLISRADLRCDVFGTYILFPSTSKEIGIYSVSIDEKTMRAEKCQCEGHLDHHYYCVHMEAADVLLLPYQQPVAVEKPAELVTVGEAITAANEQVRANIDAAAVANDKTYAEAVGFYRSSNVA